MQFIDIHGHYAWDIDDGIKTKEEAYSALQIAKQNNIVAIVQHHILFLDHILVTILILFAYEFKNYKILLKNLIFKFLWAVNYF